MATKRIEQIEPTISRKDQLQGNELFIVSQNDNAENDTGYTTKKMDIQTLKDYVLDGSSGGGDEPSTINNQNKTITQNGIYVADSGYTGLGTVTVNVPTVNNQPTKSITENGTYSPESDYTGFGEVTVNVVSKGQVIIGDETSPSHLHSKGNRLNFNGSDIWYGNNVRIGLWGIAQVNQDIRFEEEGNNIEYWLKPQTTVTGNGIYLFVADNEYYYNEGKYYWKSGDLLVSSNSNKPQPNHQNSAIAFAPKSDLIVNVVKPIADQIIVSHTATVVDGRWTITEHQS